MENEEVKGCPGSVELTTLSPPQDNSLALSPSSLSETYVSMAGPSVPKSGNEHGAMEYCAVGFENLAYTCPDRFDSTEDDIIPRQRHLSDEACTFDDISLKTRLRHRRRRMLFLDYAAYAIDSVYEEVEKIIILDVIFLIFSIITFGIGICHVDECRVSPTIPVMMSVSGGVDAAANSLGVAATLTRRRPRCQLFLRDTTRVGRAVLFFMHMYSLGVVYNSWPPEEVDKDSATYCHPTVFWVAFAFFHITTLTSLAVLLGMVAAVLCFFV